MHGISNVNINTLFDIIKFMLGNKDFKKWQIMSNSFSKMDSCKITRIVNCGNIFVVFLKHNSDVNFDKVKIRMAVCMCVCIQKSSTDIKCFWFGSCIVTEGIYGVMFSAGQWDSQNLSFMYGLQIYAHLHILNS